MPRRSKTTSGGRAAQPEMIEAGTSQTWRFTQYSNEHTAQSKVDEIFGSWARESLPTDWSRAICVDGAGIISSTQRREPDDTDTLGTWGHFLFRNMSLDPSSTTIMQVNRDGRLYSLQAKAVESGTRLRLECERILSKEPSGISEKRLEKRFEAIQSEARDAFFGPSKQISPGRSRS